MQNEKKKKRDQIFPQKFYLMDPEILVFIIKEANCDRSLCNTEDLVSAHPHKSTRLA